MSLKLANLRLELDEPEAALAEKISGRLGVGPEEIARWRILRKSLDARRHDDLHFVYAAEVELPEDEAAPGTAGARPRAATSSRSGPSPSTGPSRERVPSSTGP